MKCDLELVKAIHTQTGAPMSDCLVALQKANGDKDAAVELLVPKRRRWAEMTDSFKWNRDVKK